MNAFKSESRLAVTIHLCLALDIQNYTAIGSPLSLVRTLKGVKFVALSKCQLATC